jgi:hypothetical protein
MSGNQIFMLACVIFILGRWAKNETTVSVKIILSIIFGVIFFSVLDDTPAEEFARMLAWLVFTVAILNAIAIKGIANAITGALGGTVDTGGGTLVSETSTNTPGIGLDLPALPSSTGSTA